MAPKLEIEPDWRFFERYCRQESSLIAPSKDAKVVWTPPSSNPFGKPPKGYEFSTRCPRCNRGNKNCNGTYPCLQCLEAGFTVARDCNIKIQRVTLPDDKFYPAAHSDVKLVLDACGGGASEPRPTAFDSFFKPNPSSPITARPPLTPSAPKAIGHGHHNNAATPRRKLSGIVIRSTSALRPLVEPKLERRTARRVKSGPMPRAATPTSTSTSITAFLSPRSSVSVTNLKRQRGESPAVIKESKEEEEEADSDSSSSSSSGIEVLN